MNPKIVKIINITVLVLIVLFGLLVLSAKYSVLGTRLFVVKSGSMEPAIKTGSLVFDKKLSEYKVGDVITFNDREDTSKTITHRISKMEKQNDVAMFLTKGDANDSEDSYAISQDRIIGKSYFSIPYLGYIVGFARTPVGLIFLIVIPATILIYEEINKIRREFAIIVEERRKSREYRQQMSPSVGFGTKVKRFFSILWEVLHRTI